MVRKPKSPAPPPIAVEAAVGVNVGANYSVSKKITESVPEDVTRAKAARWLDLISPLTEWAGLKGDQLRLKRDVLRLQREETLSRIAKLLEDGPPVSMGNTPIPTKFIVNFLEKASLEDPEDPMEQPFTPLAGV